MNLFFYFYNMNYKDEKRNYNAFTFNIYSKLDDNLIIFIYTCKSKDFKKGRFLISEIFYHSFYNNKRIFNPLSDIKEINTILTDE